MAEIPKYVALQLAGGKWLLNKDGSALAQFDTADQVREGVKRDVAAKMMKFDADGKELDE